MALNSHAPRTILDVRLAQLESASGQSLPLSLRRFQESMESESVIRAIQAAASKMLWSYDRRFGVSAAVSVGRLCYLCGVELVGRVPRRISGALYSSGAISSGSKTHRAEFRVEAGRPVVRISHLHDEGVARISVAHELGHLMVHQRGSVLERATLLLGTSDEEEAVVEYAARLLLLSRAFLSSVSASPYSLAESCVAEAGRARVTLHAATLRLADPDLPDHGVRAAILWRLNPRTADSKPIEERLTPQWFACPGAFVPVGKCHARPGSLVAELASRCDMPAAGSRVEDVRIGTLRGRFEVDAFAWGSVRAGTRLVLLLCKNTHPQLP
jgi:hypothetical protein